MGVDRTDGKDFPTHKVTKPCEELSSLESKKILLERVKGDLHFQQNQLVGILDVMVDAVFIIGSDYKIQYANPAAIKTFGSAKDRQCYDYFYDREDRCLCCKQDHPPKEGGVCRTWKSPKTRQTYDVFDAPLKNPDGTVSKLHILHDITEHIELQDSFSQNEQKYRTLVETMNEGLAGYDENGLYTFVNDRFCAMVGYTREELIGHPITGLLDEANRKILREQIARRRKGEHSSYELEHITKEGDTVTTIISSSPLFDSEGRFTGGIATISDITERKHTEDLLRASERKYRLIFENSPLGIFHFNQKGVITECNDTMAKVPSYSREKIVGLDLLGSSITSALSAAISVCLAGKASSYEGACHLDKDGRTLIIKAHFAPITSNGSVLGGVGLVEDITDQRFAEEALRASGERYRELVENANSIIVRTDLDGKILFFNEFAQRFYGYTEEEVVGRNAIGTIVPTKDSYGRDLRELFRTIALHPDKVITYEGDILNRNGQRVCISWTKKVISNERGEPVGILHIGHDITARRRAEEQAYDSERRLRHLSSQLLKAHEEERRRVAVELHDSIGSSLTAIKFNTENLHEKLEEGSVLRESVESLISMVQQAIDETRAIMLDLRPSVLDDLGLLPAINWLLRQFELTQPHIRLEREIGVDEDEVPESLKIVVFRIIQESLTNVAKHSRALLVHISLVKKESMLELVVQDSGVGFDFFKDGQNGAGIGLSSMQERAELSGGIFSIKSAKGEGTRVQAMWQTGFSGE